MSKNTKLFKTILDLFNRNRTFLILSKDKISKKQKRMHEPKKFKKLEIYYDLKYTEK